MQVQITETEEITLTHLILWIKPTTVHAFIVATKYLGCPAWPYIKCLKWDKKNVKKDRYIIHGLNAVTTLWMSWEMHIYICYSDSRGILRHHVAVFKVPHKILGFLNVLSDKWDATWNRNGEMLRNEPFFSSLSVGTSNFKSF